MSRQLLITSALPYANGSIHLGHLIEHIQTDTWVRYQKMQGHEVHYICADDTHGTPIMLAAEKQGITPELLIEKSHREHLKDLQDFQVEHDLYYTTHSPETQSLANKIYLTLRDKNLITQKTIEQPYDTVKKMFLPDRFIKGECPRCHAQDQYGDNCEVCGAHYNATEMINPISVVSGSPPVQRRSEHFFLNLQSCAEFLQHWIQAGHLPPEASHKMTEWFETGLTDWDISRDGPYFGFEIPDAPNKFFYVWLDAPIGYMGTFQHLAQQKNLSFDHWWRADSSTELYHFIGKDILYFHALFWPALLHHAGYRTPTQLFIHGFLTVNGQKMSKSRGSFITARQYLDHLPADFLRYYFCAKMNNSAEDLDLNWEDFIQRVNSDLIGKYINGASRTAGFINKLFEGKLSQNIPSQHSELINTALAQKEVILSYYEEREYSKAIRTIMEITDEMNRFVDRYKPWDMAKKPEQLASLQEVCTTVLETFRILTIYLKPVLPHLALKIETFLKIRPQLWNDLSHTLMLQTKTIEPYSHLLSRLKQEQIDKITGKVT
jgi:methionyl-tRNA synthetase